MAEGTLFFFVGLFLPFFLREPRVLLTVWTGPVADATRIER